MQAYSYSITTHEYLETVPCFPDPVRSRLEGREVYLLPANSTFTEPPAKRTGYIAVWNGSERIETEDHRGVQYWPKGAPYNSPSMEMKELGPLPDGALLTRPEQTEEEKAAGRAALGVDQLEDLDVADALAHEKEESGSKPTRNRKHLFKNPIKIKRNAK